MKQLTISVINDVGSLAIRLEVHIGYVLVVINDEKLFAEIEQIFTERFYKNWSIVKCNNSLFGGKQVSTSLDCVRYCKCISGCRSL